MAKMLIDSECLLSRAQQRIVIDARNVASPEAVHVVALIRHDMGIVRELPARKILIELVQVRKNW